MSGYAADDRPRPFFVHPAEGPVHAGHQVPFAQNAQDAALQYVELWRPDAQDGDLKLIVEDCGTGRAACLTVHLATGDTRPC
jgi:hypothetical protein